MRLGEMNTKELAIQFYHILKRLQDFIHQDLLAADSKIEGHQKVLDNLKANSASIEFIRDGELQRVHFYQRFGRSRHLVFFLLFFFMQA